MTSPGKRESTALLAFLHEPHWEVTEPRRSRRARIHAIGMVLLSMAIVPILLLQFNPRQIEPVQFILIFNLLVNLFSYLLSRSPQPELGVRLFIYGTTLITALVTGTQWPDSIVIIGLLATQPLIILYAALMLGPTDTIITSLLILSTTSFVTLVAEGVEIGFGVPLLLVDGAVAILSTINSAMRERDINLIEAQATELQDYSQQLAQQVDSRTRDIKTMAEIGQVMTGTRNLDELLERVIVMITERFDYYHAQVFLLDESRRWAVLRKSTGVAGEELLARGHKLEVGSRSVIGRVTSANEPVIARDTDTDSVHRRNELLPHTRSEMALPLRVGGRVIGALDIQSINPDSFDPAAVSVFQTMADQLAIAIENARLFERAERDLEDIEALNRQLTGEAWRRYVAHRRGGAVGYRTNEGAIKPVHVAESADDSIEGTVSLPLKVRGETIGVLDLTPRDGEAPDEETRMMLEAVAERVAFALDSSRLGEQSQRQAERELILSRLSADLQATTDLNVILRTAAEEAGRALSTSRAFVHLVADYGGNQSSDS